MARGFRRADGSIPTPTQRGYARRVENRLAGIYSEIGTALDYADPWQLLVATVISAQTTDENVNRVLPELFRSYPEPADLATADPDRVEQIIYSTGFYRQKTKSIIGIADAIESDFGGVVPDTREELTALPGVGRKTANVVLAEAFGRPAIAVDTHVRRVASRLELTKETDPDRIEFDLMALLPERTWDKLSMRVIQFGRDTCDARRPLCYACPLEALCPFPNKTPDPKA